MKVLIVEDDTLVREALANFLSDGGAVVATASNGQQGLDKLREFAPDVVLLDLLMPVVDGADFLGRKAHGDLAAVPVVVTTAAKDDTLCRDPRVAAVLVKPFEVKDLLAQLHKLGLTAQVPEKLV